MTDRMKVINLFDELGVTYSLINTMGKPAASLTRDINSIVLEADSGGNVKGYAGFEAEFRFDDNDKFVDVMITE